MTPVNSVDYYKSRHLSAPDDEYQPATTRDFCAILAVLEADSLPWKILGDGQHFRGCCENQTVLRTDELDDILELDSQSCLVRVEAGIRWKDLRQRLSEKGFSLQRYGLQPASATIGGLLSRTQPGPQALRGGSLIDGCIAINAHSPKTGDYRYLTAPRKASGPDLRYEFIGTGGENGAILDATIVIWRPVSERLLRWNDLSLTDAAELMNGLFKASILPSFVHYSYKSRSLQITLTGPGQLLRSRVDWTNKELRVADEQGDADTARTRRNWLEARHPDRRTHPDAKRTRVFWVAPSALADDPTELFGAGVADIEIVSWTPQRVETFVRYGSMLAEQGLHATPAQTCWADWPLLSLGDKAKR